MKVVICTERKGDEGFCLSGEAIQELIKLGMMVSKAKEDPWWEPEDLKADIIETDGIGVVPHSLVNPDAPQTRTDLRVLQVVEKLGEKAGGIIAGSHIGLKIIAIPDNVPFEIGMWNGEEAVVQKDKIWY